MKGSIRRIDAQGNDAHESLLDPHGSGSGDGQDYYNTPSGDMKAKHSVMGYPSRKAPLPHRVSTPIDKRKQEEYGGKGTALSSIFTLASSAIGAGILSFPYAFKEAGLITAILVCLGLTS
jgi:hypothetical protein